MRRGKDTKDGKNASIELARAAKRRLDSVRTVIASLAPEERAALFVDLEDDLGEEAAPQAPDSTDRKELGRTLNNVPSCREAPRGAMRAACYEQIGDSNRVPEAKSEDGPDCATVTFRIPTNLKRRAEEMAEQRGMTITRLVVEAIEHEVTMEAPRWFAEWDAGRAPKREAIGFLDASFVDKAERFVVFHSEGVRTHEVADAIKQSTAAAFGTLMHLLRSGRVSCTGTRNKRLWTPPGVKPVPRVDTIDAALVQVLTDAGGNPVDGITLRERAIAKVVAAGGNKPRPDSTVAAIYRLVREGKILKKGANERGVLYVLAPDADEQEGEESSERILN